MKPNPPIPQPPRPPNKPQGSPVEYLPSDSECRTCAGIALFTVDMRDRGEKPVCIGITSVLKKRIPTEQLEQLNKESAPSPDFGSVINIGYTRSSGLMERTGRIPVSITGIQLYFPRRVIPKPRPQNNSQNPGELDNSSIVPTKDIITGPRSFPANPWQGLGATSVNDGLQEFQRLVRKGIKKQWEGMKKTWDMNKKLVSSTAKDFPAKMHKSVSAMAHGMDKTARVIYNKVASVWSSW